MGVALAWEFLGIFGRGMGAPVFALKGYAAASHVIPRGFACRWGARAKDVPGCGAGSMAAVARGRRGGAGD